jgi:ParB family transcriptional regulator, chromosome partitioning protein
VDREQRVSPLDEAPFDREDATLNPAAGACSACPRRSGYNTSLFFDVAADQCLDGNCYHAKLAEHIEREVAARPELVRIETDHRNSSERQPGTLSRWEYTEVEAPEDENEDAEPVTQCGASKLAIVVYDQGAGTTRTVCMDPECPVHHPSRVAPIDPDAEARRKEHEKEQARRRRLEKDRAETFSRILENVPAIFTAPQLRVLLRAFITCDLYGQSDIVATHYAGEDEHNNQSSEEILLSVADRLEDVQLPELALRLALCSHLRIPNENEIDHLAEVEKVFVPKLAKKPTAKKKAVKKPTPAKGKTAKRKASK